MSWWILFSTPAATLVPFQLSPHKNFLPFGAALFRTQWLQQKTFEANLWSTRTIHLGVMSMTLPQLHPAIAQLELS